MTVKWIVGRTEPIEDHYDLGEKIGEGAFGYAVKAIDKKTGTLRAVKVISKPSLGDDEVVGIKNEVKVLQKMKHECIIKAYGFFETGVNIYIAMEHCSGGELYERITESNYSEKNAARIIRQMTLGLEHMHKMKIAHCDIKPDNVLYLDKQSDTIKLIDFGAARFIKGGRPIKEKIGTPFYVAPEIILDKGFTTDCDIWSLGVTLFIMLFGFPPFDAEDINGGLIVQQLKEGFHPEVREGRGPWFPADIPCSDAAKDVIVKCLRKDTAKRITATELLEHPWITGAKASDKPRIREFFRNLEKFTQSTKLRHVLLRTMQDRLSVIDLKNLKEQFHALDKRGKGKIPVKDLTKAVQKLLKDNKIDLSTLLGIDHEIDYKELVKVAIQRNLIAKEERLWQEFCRLDLNRDGKLSKDEIKRVLKKDLGETKDEEEIQEWIDEVDKNKDGKIDYEEFVSMWVKVQQPKRRKKGAKKGNNRKGGTSARKIKKPGSAMGPRKPKTAGKSLAIEVGLRLSNSKSGVVVDSAPPDLPAAKAGIEKGDVIVKVNGRPVNYKSDFKELAMSFMPGTRALFTIMKTSGMKKAYSLKF